MGFKTLWKYQIPQFESISLLQISCVNFCLKEFYRSKMHKNVPQDMVYLENHSVFNFCILQRIRNRTPTIFQTRAHEDFLYTLHQGDLILGAKLCCHNMTFTCVQYGKSLHRSEYKKKHHKSLFLQLLQGANTSLYCFLAAAVMFEISKTYTEKL